MRPGLATLLPLAVALVSCGRSKSPSTPPSPPPRATAEPDPGPPVDEAAPASFEQALVEGRGLHFGRLGVFQHHFTDQSEQPAEVPGERYLCEPEISAEVVRGLLSWLLQDGPLDCHDDRMECSAPGGAEDQFVFFGRTHPDGGFELYAVSHLGAALDQPSTDLQDADQAVFLARALRGEVFEAGPWPDFVPQSQRRASCTGP